MQKYGLIGYPLRHSFSIGYFNEKFKSENIDAEYVNFEIPNINDFMEVIANLGIESVFVSRTKKESSYLTYDELTPEIMQEYTIIVNCTPVGMYPKVDFCPDIPYDQLTPNHLLYDLLYNPNETLFMKKGEAHGAVTKNGLEMLLLQAFAAWEIWNK